MGYSDTVKDILDQQRRDRDMELYRQEVDARVKIARTAPSATPTYQDPRDTEIARLQAELLEEKAARLSSVAQLVGLTAVVKALGHQYPEAATKAFDQNFAYVYLRRAQKDGGLERLWGISAEEALRWGQNIAAQFKADCTE